MSGLPEEPHLLLLLVGLMVVAAALIKAWLAEARVPAVVGYLVLGFGLRLADARWSILTPGAWSTLEFLALMGVVCLLFRVGLESDLGALLRQLRPAAPIWAGNVALSALAGFAAARWLVGLEPVPCLFVATAMTATSIGVSVGTWEQLDAMESEESQILLDVAELDDLSTVVLMSLLLAVTPVVLGDTLADLPALLGRTGGLVLVKLAALTLGCVLFSRYLEEPVTSYLQRRERGPDPMLSLVGIGLFTAAVAELLGFSVAIGAFFAGLVFSRDPRAVRMEASFGPVYALLIPFFFLGIGLKMDPSAMGPALGWGLVFLGVAVAGKVVGTALPAWSPLGRTGGLLLGCSMIPRAEIAMVVMQEGLALGPEAVPPSAYGAMVVVAFGTSVLAPFAVQAILRRHPVTPLEDEP